MNGGRLKCPLCEEQFWNEEELREHVDRVHGMLGGSDVLRAQRARVRRGRP